MNPTTQDWILTTAKAGFAAFAGAGLTALATWAAGADFGSYTPWVAALLGLGINAARKALAEWVNPPR